MCKCVRKDVVDLTRYSFSRLAARCESDIDGTAVRAQKPQELQRISSMPGMSSAQITRHAKFFLAVVRAAGNVKQQLLMIL